MSVRRKSSGGTLARAAGYLLVMTLIFGLAFPLAVTGASQLLFPHQANGSMIVVDGVNYGCELLGQEFSDMDHLWGRIMNVDTGGFTDEEGNPRMYGWASNLSPASPEYEELVARRVELLRQAHPEEELKAVPVDLVTCSGSGLDPHISPAAAAYQVSRLAAHTDFSEEEIQAIIDKYTEGRFLGIFGEPRVNVLKVNLALDGIL